MSDETERTTVPLERSTRDRLDDLAPAGSSWDDRVNALLDDHEEPVAESVEVRLDEDDRELLEQAIQDTSSSAEDVATVDDLDDRLDGLRDDLLGQLPVRTAHELREQFDRR